MVERALPRSDEAVSDLVSTLLLVLVAVVLGSAVAVGVAAKLGGPAATPVSFAMDPVEPGDDALRVILRHGGPVAVDDLHVTLQRGEQPAAEVPSSAWGIEGQDIDQGAALRVPLDPVLAAGERVHVVVAQRGANAILAQLDAVAPTDADDAARASLNASFDPPMLRPDGASASTLAVRVTHPHGALLVSSVTADLRNVTDAAHVAHRSLALADDGRDGDRQGSDGVWSATLTLASTTPDGAYEVPIRAFDALGREIGEARATVVVAGGAGATLGTSFYLPSSQNVTTLRATNFSYDELDVSRLSRDSLRMIVLDGTRSWSITFVFDARSGVAYLSELRIAGNGLESVVLPTDTRIPLDGLEVDILDPTADGSWYVKSGAPISETMYGAAKVGDPARASIVFAGDEQSVRPSDVGIRSLDVVVR